MPNSKKKVIVKRLAGDFFPGYLAPAQFLRPIAGEDEAVSGRALDLLDLEGRSLPVPLAEVKLICFVRDFNRDDPENPERLTRRAFLARPRSEGLWVRITFPAGDQLEGLAPQDLTLLDSLLDDAGLFLTPPDERANTHRIYVPRAAISTLEVLAVIQAPGRRPAKAPSKPAQPRLFPS